MGAGTRCGRSAGPRGSGGRPPVLPGFRGPGGGRTLPSPAGLAPGPPVSHVFSTSLPAGSPAGSRFLAPLVRVCVTGARGLPSGSPVLLRASGYLPPASPGASPPAPRSPAVLSPGEAVRALAEAESRGVPARTRSPCLGENPRRALQTADRLSAGSIRFSPAARGRGVVRLALRRGSGEIREPGWLAFHPFVCVGSRPLTGREKESSACCLVLQGQFL